MVLPLRALSALTGDPDLVPSTICNSPSTGLDALSGPAGTWTRAHTYTHRYT